MLKEQQLNAINTIRSVIEKEGSLDAAICYGIDQEISALGLDIQLAAYEKARATLENSLEKMMNSQLYSAFIAKKT